MEIKVHPCGTTVVIDNDANTIGTRYVGMDTPREIYSQDAKWLKEYRYCRVCGEQLDDERFARAFWRHESQVCSTACYSKEQLARYACCEQAVTVNCVCMYAISCPVHGGKHYGTHD
jgi:hypothetical protein